MNATLKHIRSTTLDIAHEESGIADGTPVFLMHGWPYDPRCYDEVVPPLAAAGCRVIVPYLRGFGETRFLSAATPRSGQQAALGNDLRELMDALKSNAPCRRLCNRRDPGTAFIAGRREFDPVAPVDLGAIKRIVGS
jgi:hypothetical protein